MLVGVCFHGGRTGRFGLRYLFGAADTVKVREHTLRRNTYLPTVLGKHASRYTPGFVTISLLRFLFRMSYIYLPVVHAGPFV